MGQIIQMVCVDCNYESQQLRFGPFWTDRRNIAPALNTNNKTIIEVDQDSKYASHIVLYTSEKLQGKRQQIQAGTTESESIELKRTGNFCPACNGFTLKVEIIASVD